jgi:hypothetical protein
LLQRCDEVLQAWLVCTQSPVALQPHRPLTQAVPDGLPVQVLQTPPEVPQAVGEVPATQVVLFWQQPPLQARPPVQVVEHT